MRRPSSPEKTTIWEWLIAAILVFATAAVVFWQNYHLAILWDLSAILDNAYRISLGEIPYRDFPLPFPPLTFLMQAALIKLTGRVYFHHVIYAVAAGGLATFLTWRILLYLLRERAAFARVTALLLSAPLVFLGICSIFPHPFYDSDCTLAVLLAVFLLLRLEHADFSSTLRAFFTGGTIVVPLLVKQNAGLAFLAAGLLCLAILTVLAKAHGRPVRIYLSVIAGTVTAFALALLLIHWTAGVKNYWHWTVQFAASRRLPPFADLLALYEDPQLLWRIAAFFGGALLMFLNRKTRPVLVFASTILLSLPFIWTLVSLGVEADSSDRAAELLALWPFLLVVSFAVAVLRFGRSARAGLVGTADVLPFVLIATVHGAFLSQQVWGSTYALWPLFLLLCAGTFSGLACLRAKPAAGPRAPRLGPLTPENMAELAAYALVSLSLLVAGRYYALSHERLSYAKVSEGEMVRSALPELRGLTVRGPWIPELEALARFAGQEIPTKDGLLLIPGEDPFYYATGRRPQFPVLTFDHTLDPFSPEEIEQMVRARGIRWLVIKRKLQINGQPVEDQARLFSLLSEDFQLVRSLGIYDVYRRIAPRIAP